jgi:hypothetical protein
MLTGIEEVVDEKLTSIWRRLQSDLNMGSSLPTDASTDRPF